ncbi:hypothetical protein NQ318_013201, partial [Aromia moschata]
MAPTKRKRVALLGILLFLMKAKQKREDVNRKRRIWVKNSLQLRPVVGIEEKLLTQLLTEHGDGFKNFLRMDHSRFLMLHNMIEHYIKKQDTQMRGCINSRLQLATTLRFLATGDSYKSLKYLTRISASTISIFVPKVCKALYVELQPSSKACFRGIVFNCEATLSPNLSNSDDSAAHASLKVFKAESNSLFVVQSLAMRRFFTKLECGVSLRFTVDSFSLFSIVDANKPMPYVILGDDAFSLSRYLLKQFPRSANLNAKQIVFNYRLSRARRIIENAFGILTARFRIFRKPICLNIDSIDKVVLATCVLHNFLKQTTPENPNIFENEGQPSNIRNIEHQGSNNYSILARSIREEFADYFYNEGQ